MFLKFQYVSGGVKADFTLHLIEGELNERQKELLIREINKQEVKLIKGKAGHFKPESTIDGLPEDIVLEYTYIPTRVTSRTVTFEMSWIDKNTPIKQDQHTHANTGFLAESNQTEINSWSELYLKSLTQRLDTLSKDSCDRFKKSALDCTVAELQEFLTSHANDAELLLFTAYLHFAAIHYSPTDRDKAGFFLLAARLIEAEQPQHDKMDVTPVSLSNTFKSETPNVSLEESDGIFTKIFHRFFER